MFNYVRRPKSMLGVVCDEMSLTFWVDIMNIVNGNKGKKMHMWAITAEFPK